MIEQRALPGVGVTNNAHRTKATARSAFGLLAAVVVQVDEVATQFDDLVLNFSSVNFEFGFTRASRTNACTLLRHCFRNTSAQTRQLITKQRKFYLCFTFERVCVLGKDVEDDSGAIDRGTTKQLF